VAWLTFEAVFVYFFIVETKNVSLVTPIFRRTQLTSSFSVHWKKPLRELRHLLEISTTDERTNHNSLFDGDETVARIAGQAAEHVAAARQQDTQSDEKMTDEKIA
jgi:hypothetical protein